MPPLRGSGSFRFDVSTILSPLRGSGLSFSKSFILSIPYEFIYIQHRRCDSMVENKITRTSECRKYDIMVDTGTTHYITIWQISIFILLQYSNWCLSAFSVYSLKLGVILFLLKISLKAASFPCFFISR
jgi:hypothetical protein